MTMSYKIEGLPKVEHALKMLDRETQTRIARQAIRAAGKPIADEARRRVPVRTGTLYRAIRQAVLPKKRYGQTAAGVVVRSGKKYQAKNMDGWYAHMVEYGTVKQNPQPFMRPALDSKGAEAISRAADELWKRIIKIMPSASSLR